MEQNMQEYNLVPTCRICMETVADLDEQGIRVFDNYFCNCVGTQRFMCEGCARNYIMEFGFCNECLANWRNVELVEAPLTFHRFYQQFARSGWQKIIDFINVILNVAFISYILFVLDTYEEFIKPMTGPPYSSGKWIVVVVIGYYTSYFFHLCTKEMVTWTIVLFLWPFYVLFGGPFVKEIRLIIL